MRKFLVFICLLGAVVSHAQIGKTFWFAAPEVTDGHGTGRGQEIRVSTFDSAATVRIYQPANLTTGLDTTFTVAANSSESIVTTPWQEEIETKPFDQVVQTGILIESDVDITAYYEVTTTNNPDIFAMKASNALGTEFYLPFQNIRDNGNYTPTPYAQFNVVATEDNTTIWIFPSVDMLNHAGKVPYSITLNRGETYSGRALSRDAADHPTGTIISSDKPIAVTYADDSVIGTGGGCRDLMGDQLVPKDIVGLEYIVNHSEALFDNSPYVPETVVIVATENFTTVEKNGVVQKVLFAGQSYVDTTTASTYYRADKPIYLTQTTGFGCELGAAILPPLNCAGSDQVSFGRNSNGGLDFFLSILIRAGSEGDFTLNGDASLIQASDFAVVPGTGGEWMTMFKSFTTGEVAPGDAHRVVNSSDVFSLGVVNGNETGGTRYGYFSLFQSEIIVDAGADQFVCSGNNVDLVGSVRGGAVNGLWTVANGNGTFDDANSLSTTYNPTATDYATGNLTFVLESTGLCTVEYDTMIVNFTPGPTIDAGSDVTVCYNNADIALDATYNGVVSSVLWSTSPANTGGFSPGNTSDPATYTPTIAQLDAGSFYVYATSVGVGSCQPVTDSLEVTVVASPIVEAGPAQSACANNPDVTLGASITTYSGLGQGVWSGGGNSISPSDNALTGTYTPTPTEITNGSVLLTLTSINNNLCNAETDNVTITYTDAPTVDAGSDATYCANNSDITLNGSFTAPATAAVWVGGAGTFNPDRNTMNAVYTPDAGEIALGTVTLTLQSSAGNGTCIPATDQVTYTFTPSPTIDAGSDQTVCANDDQATFTAVFTTAAGVLWSGGNGTYVSGNTSNPLDYRPSAAETTAGSAKLYATTTGIGNCNAVTDSAMLIIEAAPIVEAGTPLTTCANNPDATLSGSVTTYLGFGQGNWSGGSGSVSPASDALTGVYTPTSSEISTGTVVLNLTSVNNGICNAESDNVTLTIEPAPTVNAGSDQSLCANNTDVTLNGSATNNDAQWIGGSGTFNPDRNTLNAVYTPTATEVSLGTLTLTLQTTNNGLCNPETDDITITFTPSPTVDAGSDATVCANNSSVALSASRTIAGGVQWSGGAGNYTPNALSDNITYEPSAAEITAGSVKLYATTTGVGNCNTEVDSVTISIAPAPIVNAGTAIESCENNPDAQLVGSVTPYTGLGQGTWSGGAGFVTPSNDALTGVYTPTSTEITNGVVNLTLTSTNNTICNAESDDVTLTIVPAPTVNAGTDIFVCANNATAPLNGSVANAGGAQWLGGLGTFTPDRTTLNATYTPTQDEINLGSLTLTLESTGTPSCNNVQDQVVINFTSSPTADAGLNQTVCANNADVQLDGSFSISTGAIWNGFGGTIVTGTTTDMNAVYRPSAAEITAGTAVVYLTTTGNGLCTAETDSMIVTITPDPTVDAGTDITVCANNSTAQLDGSFTIAGGVQWSGGTGSFTPSNQIRDAEYFPTSSEIATGFVNLTLTTTANGLCNAVSDNVLINITPAPTVNAGSDQSICENNSVATLNASVNLATGVTWSGGLGSFNPDENQLITEYTATPTEVNNGSVELIATSTGNGICNADADTLTLTFAPAPIVDAGDPITVCANNANTFLNGQVLGATGGRWTNFTGSFNPDNTTLNATYLPSAAEITAGTAMLYLESTGNGNCLPVQDSVEITITPGPTVDAGPAQTTCANNSTVQLAGSFSNATGVTWSGGTGSFVPAITDRNAQYNPSVGEIAAGTVTLTLSSTGNGTCFAVSDDITITISGAPTVDAGADQVKCANNSDIQLSGGVTLATGGVWSGGLGTFTPDATTANATYEPTQTEINTGLLTLTYTTTGNGSCNAESDDVAITFTPEPTVEAGIAKVTCANNPDVVMDGAVTVATGAQWFGYSGSFSPGDTDPTATYTPSATEIANGTVTLRLRSTGNGTCIEVSDSVVVNISPAPFVDAGEDVFNCIDDLDVPVNGVIAGGSSTGQWTTTGTGFFTPNANTLNAVYVMSPQDSLAGTVTLTLTSTNNGDCIAESDQLDVFLTTPGVANAGADASVCANNSTVALNGIVTGGALGGVWSTSGSGTFVPDENALNAAYVPSAADTADGTVTLTLTANSCDQNQNDMVITITDAPSVDAGTDQTVCSDDLVDLTGTVSGASTTGIWSSTGTGSFIPNPFTLNAQYQSSAADRLNGGVELVLLSSNVGSCIPVLDTVEITIREAGVVNAGNDRTVCANLSDVNLSGNLIAGGVFGRWTTSGTGAFQPNDTDLNATYEPSSADITNGSVILKLTSNSCDAAADSLRVTITDAPTVNAGSDVTVCANNSDIALTGSTTIAGGALWSTNGGGSFSDIFDLNATFTPGALDQDVVLYLTTFGSGNCLDVTDSIAVTVTPAPVVVAGPDQVLCDGISRVDLQGSVTGGATTGIWSSLGTGGFDPGAVLLETDYLLSSTDSVNRGVTLILESTNNGLCNAEFDTLEITITDVGTSDAGADVDVCANDPLVQLNGIIQGGATQGYWTTSGSGTFAPDSSVLNAVYTPSSQDSLDGTVTLSLVSNSCDGAADDKVITINPAPFVSAGPDQATCVDDLSIQLDGIIAGASTTGRWSSSGTGQFIPNDQTLNAVYEASSNDSISGSVTLTLNPTNIGNCLSVNDAIELRITTGGTANAGPDQIVCSNTTGIQLAGSFGGGADQATWTSTGTGVFLPNATDLNAVYSPSDQDKVNGIVNLTLTTNSCDQASDDMQILITPAPSVEAGNNYVLCENNTDASLFGQVAGAAGGIWSTTGSGAFLPSNSSLSATYIPSAADIASGGVLLYLTTIGNGNCAFERDSLDLTFTEAPRPDAGLDLTVCKTSLTVTIQGSVSGPTTTGEWSSIQGGGGFLTNIDELQTEYLFGPVDTTRGFVSLILTSTNNGTCNAVTDTVTVTLGGTTFAAAGNDIEVCNESLLAQLNGFIGGGASSGTWTSNGDGQFSPDNNALNATYRFGAADSINGFVQLVLTANAGGGCAPGTDTVVVAVSDVPSVDAGEDIVICAGRDTVVYAGTGTNTTSHQWVTNGSGFFVAADDTSLTNGYILGAGDKFLGGVDLILTGETAAGCQAQPDTVSITIGDPLDMEYFIRNLCVGDETEFADSSKIEFGTITSWLWRFGDGQISDVQHPKHVYDEATIYEVGLFVTTNQGCVDSLKRTVTVRPSPTADFELNVPNVDEIKIGEEVEFVDQSLDAAAWTWVFGINRDTSYLQYPIYIYDEPGDYDVELTVLSQFGCSDTVTKTITILTDAVLPPNVPNAFTPNGEGAQANEIFEVRGGPFLSLDFRIYNEWGNVVFETTDPDVGWDGKKDGDYQPEGVYTYTLKATLLDGRSYKKTGDVTLIR